MGSQESSKESLNSQDNLQLKQISLPPIPPHTGAEAVPDLIEVFWNGNLLTIECNTWEEFLHIHWVGRSNLSCQQVEPTRINLPASTCDSMDDSAKGGSNSVLLPTGFEKLAKTEKSLLGIFD
ncbi:uncharacterized protein A4U43_C08F21790 [Asparagus officinalis]|nr:uncharacterized protein A4U43_C08F21790 [Asparagus officinalis]